MGSEDDNANITGGYSAVSTNGGNEIPLKEGIPNGDMGKHASNYSDGDQQSNDDYELLNQQEFDERYDGGLRPTKGLGETLSDLKDDCECSGKCIKKKVTGLIPFLKIPQYYNMKEDFVNDLIAGLTVGIMQIPMGKSL